MYHNIEQNTEEWFQLRAGKLTGSGFSKVMANDGKAFGEPAKKYAADIALEQITGRPISSNYTNEHMQRGHEQKPIARMLYESDNFLTVDNGGFFECEWVGVSPDGLVGKSGIIEIKSVIPNVHFANIKRKTYDPAYKWQVIGNLMFTEREWIDFVSYCADFPEDKQLYTYRLYAKDCRDEFGRMKERIGEFKRLVESARNLILESSYFLSSAA